MMYGSASAIPWLETIISSGDDSETTEDAGTNAPRMVMKFVLYAAAFALICVVSCLLMIYMTAVGLWRNYDWTPVLAKVKAAASANRKG